jgi:hypothetical protein
MWTSPPTIAYSLKAVILRECEESFPRLRKARFFAPLLNDSKALYETRYRSSLLRVRRGLIRSANIKVFLEGLGTLFLQKKVPEVFYISPLLPLSY